ncbi:major facilitator superfamily MFS_1 [Paraglaciecola sp. T6c]|uniref:MFS transporter n=1 Tax=Pseudoalteromonas atlantica (strain T6c / ATCC BAA-1087) TaxID=3042615 RepID=UPI00005C6C25|nr:MFS transporter [Paraglaciecola sp. T6c]ABG38736.1 major facilitator superfamily MFS_1 [Paraglaciecola sp. T6c]
MPTLLQSMFSLLFSAAILLVGHGLQLTIVPLYAISLGWEPDLIGYIGSSYFLGFVLGCLTVPRLVARVGHIRVFTVLIALFTASLLFIGLVDHFALWLIARCLIGWGIAGIYMVIESWLNDKTSIEHRGSVLSVYTVISLSAICVGQLLVGFELGYAGLFMLAAALLVLGIVPVGLTRRAAPQPIPAVSFSFRRLFAVSQVAMVGAFFGGLVTGGFWALGPVIADANQLSAGQVGVFMAVTILGGTALQLPVGRLSDRIDRRYVITGLAVVAVLTSIAAIMLDSRTPEVIYVTMFLLGGLSFPLYSLCLAHANDNTDLSIMEVGSGVLMMNSVGSILGPLTVSFLLGYTHMALFVVSGVALSILACWTLYRIRFHDVAREHYEPFVNMRNTTQEVVEMGLESEEPEEPLNTKVETIETDESLSKT